MGQVIKIEGEAKKEERERIIVQETEPWCFQLLFYLPALHNCLGHPWCSRLYPTCLCGSLHPCYDPCYDSTEESLQILLEEKVQGIAKRFISRCLEVYFDGAHTLLYLFIKISPEPSLVLGSRNHHLFWIQQGQQSPQSFTAKGFIF